MPRTLPSAQSDLGGIPPIANEPFGWDGDGGEGGGNPEERGASRQTSMVGLVVMMCASVMTFAALASALIVRRGLGTDWHKMPLPWILWPNTGVLLLSSIVLDTARRLLRRGRRVLFNWLWCAGTLLGLTFLAGQSAAWSELHTTGQFLAKNPANGFFYVLTWTHAAHAVAGLIALLYVAAMALRFRLGPSKRTVVDVSTMFWHFLDVLWIFIMLMLIYY
jgi:cytochrome c oxidase subunit 3